MKPPGLFRLTLANLARWPGRHAILLLAAAAVAGLQMAAATIDDAARAGLELGLERLGADLVVIPRDIDIPVERAYITGEASLFYMDRSIKDKVDALPFVKKTSAQLYIKSLAGASCCSAWDVFLIGFDPETDFTVRPWLRDNPDIELGPDDILVGAALAAPGGTPMKFYGRSFKIAGSLAPSGMGLDTTVFIPLESAYRMAEESSEKAEKTLEIGRETISAVMVRLKSEDEGGLPAYRAAYEIEMAVPEATVVRRQDMATRVHRNLSGTLRGLRSAGYTVWPVAAVLVGLVFYLAAWERRREIGILRALGATRSFVFRMIVFEALFITGPGAALGVAISAGLVAGFGGLIAHTLEIPFRFPGLAHLFRTSAVFVAAALVTGALAAAYPAIRAASMEPYEAIRTGH